MMENGQSPHNVPSLHTLASQVEITPGNNLLHQFVRDNRLFDHLCSESPEEGILHIVLTSLYDSQVPVNTLNRDGYSALHLAVLHNNASMVKNLLVYFKTLINANVKDKFGNTPLYMAAMMGQHSIVEELLKVPRIDVNEKCGRNNYTPFHIAVKEGHDNVVKELLKAPGILVNEECEWDMYTPLYLAAKMGDPSVVKELLKFPWIDVNKKCSFNNCTPLHIAVKEGHDNVIHELLKIPGIMLNGECVYCMSYAPLYFAQKIGRSNKVMNQLKALEFQDTYM